MLRPREIEDELRRAHALIFEKLPQRAKAAPAKPEKERAGALSEQKKPPAQRKIAGQPVSKPAGQRSRGPAGRASQGKRTRATR